MKLNNYTVSLLEDIEKRIDSLTEEDFNNQWEMFLKDGVETGFFTPKRKKVTAPGIALKNININDAVNNDEQMLIYEMRGISNALNTYGNALNVRANYGTGILSSLFGAEIFMMPYELNTLPTTRAFNDDDRIREIVSGGIPDLNTGLGRKVFAMGEIYREVFSKYPNIARFVHVYHPDLQGPLDICELLWGCHMFYAMYDESELVHSFISLITETYIKFMDKWFSLYPPSGMSPHWSIMFKGNIMLRNDSAMNLSPDLYKEYAYPYDKKLLESYNGGCVHFCGRGDHYIDILCDIPGLYAINMSQPHLNDMEKIYRNTVDKGIMIIDYSREYAEKDKEREGGFKGRIHVK